MSSIAEKIKAKGKASIKARPLLKQIETAPDTDEAYPEQVDEAFPDMSEDKAHYHPIANVEPMMTKPQMSGLIKSIEQDGYDAREPIVMYKNKQTGILQILDGRNRDTACSFLGVEPTYIEFDGDDDAALRESERLNGIRRHKTPDQIAMQAAYEVLAQRALREQYRDNKFKDDKGNLIKLLSTRDASKKHKSTRTRVDRCVKLINRDDEVARSVFQGKLPLNQAERILDKKDRDIETQEALVNGDIDTPVRVEEIVDMFISSKYGTAKHFWHLELETAEKDERILQLETELIDLRGYEDREELGH